ncbi:MAG: hypothetical protein H6737_28365 [Alphaproteobacteria bacterium]|nr:hypothetical protein [Alphaproteobacteria bacterium]
MSNEDLQAWIDAVDRLDAKSLPSRDEMRAVARDVGLDDGILERAADRAEELRVQGQRFLDSDLPAEAVGVLTQARTLEPWSLEILELLGRAHLALWRASGDAAARSAAEGVARTLIDAAADSPAGYAILKGLQQQRRSALLPAILGGAALLGVVLGAGALWASSRTTAVEAGPVVAPAPATVHVGDLDVRVVRGPLPDGMEVEVTAAAVTPTPGGEGWIVNVAAILRNGAPQVVSGAVATVKALDAEGRIVASSDLELVASHDPALYQGDRADEETYLRGTRQLGQPTAIELEIARLDAQAGTRSVGEPVPVEWKVEKPASVDVVVTRREGGECGDSLGAVHCGGVFVVENTGSVPIEILKVDVDFGGGKSGETYAIASRNRAVAPGEHTPFRVAKRIDAPAPPGPWRFVVTSLRTP